MIPRDINAIRKMMDVESGSCPSCHKPFDKGKKRRLIDQCGHERCYQCMFTSDVCPICRQDAYSSTRTTAIIHNRMNRGMNATNCNMIMNKNSANGGSGDVGLTNSCRPKLKTNGHFTTFMQNRPDVNDPLSSSRQCNSYYIPVMGSPRPPHRQFYPPRQKQRPISIANHSQFGDVDSEQHESICSDQRQEDGLYTRLGLLLGDNTSVDDDCQSEKGQRPGEVMGSEFQRSFSSSMASCEATSTSPNSTLTGSSGLDHRDGASLMHTSSEPSSDSIASLMSTSTGCPTNSTESPIIPSRRHSITTAVHRSNEEFGQLTNRNSHVRRSERISTIAKTKPNIQSVQPLNKSVLSLKPLFFEIPSTENEPLFIGRQWLYKKIDQVLSTDGPKNEGVVIIGGVGHGKTSAMLQLVEYSCFGRKRTDYASNTQSLALQHGLGCPTYSHLSLIQDSARALASEVVAYHFCQADNTVTCLIPEFVHNLAAQLCQAPQLKAYRDLLLNGPFYQKLLSIEECVYNPLRSLVKGILDPLINLKRVNKIDADKCIIVIDGVSEAEFHRADYGDTIASFLAKYQSRFPSWLKVIVTVRTAFQDVTKLLPFHRITLDKISDNELLSKDIQDYIMFRLNSSPAIRRNVTVNTGKIAEASPGRFTNYLTTMSKGSFLFVKLTLDMIERGRLVMKSTSFKVLPVTIAELFLLQFNLRFPSIKSFEKISCILNICLAALQPMTMLEIYHSINASFTDCTFLWEDFIQRMEVLTSAGFLVKRKDETLMFCHASFREWLTRRDDCDSTKFLCDAKAGHAMNCFRLCRIECPLSAEKTLELAHHILKAHIYKSVSRSMEYPSRDAQALWLCMSSQNLSEALSFRRNMFSPNVKVSRLLLIAGADPNALVDDVGCQVPVLVLAAKLGLTDMVSLLIEFNADINVVSQETGMSALSYAATSGNMDIIRMLLVEGARLNEIDKNKKCALVHAAQNGHLNAVSYLLQCDWLAIESDSVSESLLDLTEAAQQALTAAALKGHTNICDYLLDMPEVKVNECDSMYDETALTAACTTGCKEVCSAVIKRGANVSVRNGSGTPPLVCAVTEGHYEVVEFLLNCCQAELEQFDSYGRTALMLAAMEGHHGVIEFLLSKKASVNRTDKEGLTALCWACLKGQLHAAEFLLDHGSDINHTDKTGRTPLDLAAFHGNAKLVSLLIEKGSEIEHVDHNGMRPLDRAIGCKHSDVVVCFLRKGAKLGQCTWVMAAGKPRIFLILLTKLMEDGMVLYKRNRIKEAAHRFQYSLKKFPDENFGENHSKKFDRLKTQLYLNLSRCKRRLNEFDIAVDLANKALQIDPACYEAYYTRARARRDLGEFFQANSDVQKALNLSPPSRDIRKILLEMQQDMRIQVEQGGGRLSKSVLDDNRNADLYSSNAMLSNINITEPIGTTSPARNLNNLIYSTCSSMNTDSGISLDSQITDMIIE